MSIHGFASVNRSWSDVFEVKYGSWYMARRCFPAVLAFLRSASISAVIARARVAS